MSRGSEWLNNNSVAATIVAVVVLVVAPTVFSITNMRGNGRNVPTTHWSYDLDARQLFEVPIAKVPPIDTTSGKEKGIAAIVYTCSDGVVDRRIAWLQEFCCLSGQTRGADQSTAPGPAFVTYVSFVVRSSSLSTVPSVSAVV